MSIGLDISATSSHSSAAGDVFESDIDSTPWTSKFDGPLPMTSTASTGAVPTPNVTPSTEDISLGQRMISATAGNILTGLLGECQLAAARSSHTYYHTDDNFPSHSLGRCTRTTAIAITNIYGRAIYYTYHSDVEEPTAEPRNYIMLP
jgi:hypothetical protein